MASIVFDIPSLLPVELKARIRDLHREDRVTAAKTVSGALVISFGEVPQTLLNLVIEASAKGYWVRGPRVLEGYKPIDTSELNQLLAFQIIPPLGGWQKIINSHKGDEPPSKLLLDSKIKENFPKHWLMTDDGLGEVQP